MDQETFKKLILPRYARMLALAMRILHPDAETARDAVQDSLTSLWEHRRSINPESIDSFCLTIVRNRCISILRKSKPTLDLDKIPEPGNDDASSDTSQLLMAISTLPARHQKVMKMSINGFANDEIAGELHTSPENVRQMLSRARRQIKDILSKI